MKKGALLPFSCRLPIRVPLRNKKSGKEKSRHTDGIFLYDIFIVQSFISPSDLHQKVLRFPEFSLSEKR
jgi:hypothetical protein